MSMRRREFLGVMGGAAAAWPYAASAQQPALPVIGLIRDGSADANARYVAAFRKGLNETGYIESQNVTVEYHWLEGQYDRLPALMADLVRRQVAVIATPGNAGTFADKAATATIPIESCSSRSRLATTSEVKKLMPVALPPGRARLATRPSRTGSSPTPKTRWSG